MYSFSIVIPIYNEIDNINSLISEIENSINFVNNFEIVIVDDCSTDGSEKKITKYLQKKNIKLIKNKKNEGQSYSISVGIKNSSSNIIVTIDGDGQNDPKDIKKLYDRYTTSTKIKLVSGIRNKRKDNFIKVSSSVVANYIRNLILKDGCRDTGCSLKIFDRNIFLSFPFFNGIHRFLPALFVGFGYKVIYTNVNHRKRFYGKSKYGMANRLFRGIKDLILVKKIISKK